MRIVLTVDPNIPVPPSGYGGIERIADFLARGLVARGHEVTLLAHPQSRTAGTLVPYGVPPHTGTVPRIRELAQVGGYLLQHWRRFDLVHSFGRLAALTPVLPIRALPKLQSYQRDRVPWGSVAVAVRLGAESVRFTGCSTSVYRERPAGPAGGRWHTVYNGADVDKYRAVTTVADDAPLVFLGRLAAFKGPHHAIAIARAAGRRLVLAGPREPNDGGYFDCEIAPHLGDVDWVGELDDAGKNALLGRAAALLMPIEWEEPFGIVMAEALACGTPVIGFARGSVTEIVRDGVNGFVVRDVAGAVAAVARLGTLDRRIVRIDCEARFSDRAIVDAYEALYREMAG
ncbi:MAG TPA: glycosyltransferase [Gemmatimonadaceae bacterium]|nr:glycosyltransferase [Gemmatimonadaceae bacterium]